MEIKIKKGKEEKRMKEGYDIPGCKSYSWAFTITCSVTGSSKKYSLESYFLVIFYCYNLLIIYVFFSFIMYLH